MYCYSARFLTTTAVILSQPINQSSSVVQQKDFGRGFEVSKHNQN